MAVATVYTNLGDEAVAHALNETQVKVVVTSHDLLPKFQAMLPKLEHIEYVIVMEDQLHPTLTTGFKEDVKILPFRSVVTQVLLPPLGNDTANAHLIKQMKTN